MVAYPETEDIMIDRLDISVNCPAVCQLPQALLFVTKIKYISLPYLISDILISLFTHFLTDRYYHSLTPPFTSFTCVLVHKNPHTLTSLYIKYFTNIVIQSPPIVYAYSQTFTSYIPILIHTHFHTFTSSYVQITP